MLRMVITQFTLKLNQMDKQAIEGLKKEQENKELIDDIKKSIRHLEIELDFEESRSNNYKYVRNLEKQIDDLYEKLDQYQ